MDSIEKETKQLKIDKSVRVAPNNRNRIVIDTNITPIYPVRYAYANFFDDDIADPSNPPSVSKLLNASDLCQTDGYVIRLLREGWIYIREEDNEQNGHFHIFKYEKIERNGETEEKFTKYLFKNKVNAQAGLVKDTSRSAYPFVFVRNGIETVSIAYSEHEWHPNVIDKINGNKIERDKALQWVSLVEENDHALEATKDNFTKLIEDYKDRKDRLLALSQADASEDIKQVTLDILTTEAAFELEAESIATELQEKIEYGETARIVALYDPLGRQKEIASAHVKLSLWEKNYASANIYPYTIGNIVNEMRKTKDEDIQEIVEDSIDWQAHKKYWQDDLHASLMEFKSRQEQFAKLYEDFMMAPGLTGSIGSLDTYFKTFFSVDIQDNEALQLELQKLCIASVDMYAGILSSIPSRQAIDNIFNQAADDDISGKGLDSTNALYVSWFGIRALITTPQKGFSWDKASKLALDKVLTFLGPLLGDAKSQSIYLSKLTNKAGLKYSANTLRYITDTITPAIFKLFDIEIDPNQVARFTHDGLAKVIAKHIDENIPHMRGSVTMKSLKRAELKLNGAQALFDWAEKARTSTLPGLVKKIAVPIIKAPKGTYDYIVPDKIKGGIALMFDSSFTGLSILLNVQTVHGIMYQSDFDKADPTQLDPQWIGVGRTVQTVTSLTFDLVQIAKAADQVASGRATQLAARIAPKLGSKGQLLGKLLAKQLSYKLLAVINLAGAIVSGYDTVQSFQNANYGEAAGHALLTIGSAMLFAQACYGIAAGAGLVAAGSSWSVLGGVVFGVIALLAIVVGAVTVFIFGKSRFQLLLEGCIWGVGEKHLFYGNSKPFRSFEDKLKWAGDISDKSMLKAFSREHQEFLNLLYQPALEVDVDRHWTEAQIGIMPRTITYKFRLPGFQPGISNLVGEIHTDFDEDDGVVKSTPSAAKNAYLKKQINEADIVVKDGMTEISFNLHSNEDVTLYWSYFPTPEVQVPRRVMDDDGELIREIVGMADEKLV